MERRTGINRPPAYKKKKKKKKKKKGPIEMNLTHLEGELKKMYC